MLNKKEKQSIDVLIKKIESLDYISDENDFLLTKHELLVIISFLRKTHILKTKILQNLFNKIEEKQFKK
jgi:hypothetical protein